MSGGFIMKSIKPKFYSLSVSGYTIVYKCGNCSRIFNMADSEFLYCPKCGKKIDWGVIETVNEEWKSKYLSAKESYWDKNGEFHGESPKAQEMRDQIDNYNKTIIDGQRYEMQKTKATKQAIIKSNIGYYLGIGWSKDELIMNKKFTEEEMKLYDPGYEYDGIKL